MQRLGEKRAQEPSYDDELDDDDFDELMVDTDTIPSSSPYFTQPTQIVKRPSQSSQRGSYTTQPTQIVNRATQPTQITSRTTLRPVSPPQRVSASPNAAVEVPASSPFQSRLKSGTSPLAEKPLKSVASLMAPAGTMFRPPPTRAPASPSKIGLKKPAYLTIEDDDLSLDYKHHDSSADESPMRGDIKPSSFTKKEPPSQTFKPKSSWPERDIHLNEISDLRLRGLTKQVYRTVSTIKKDITVRECRDVLQKNVGFQVADAVHKIIGNASGSARKSALSNESTSQTNSLTSSIPTSTSTVTKSISHSSKTPIDQNPPPPKRRRLIQGRRHRSPTPPPVFSVSSSASSQPTTPAESTLNTPKREPSTQASGVELVSSQDDVKLETEPKKSRRRLQRGRRKPTPPPAFIDLASDPESCSDLPSLSLLTSTKRKAEEALVTETLDISSDSDHDKSASATPADRPSSAQMEVLRYLNKCTSESLAQISGFTVADSEIIVSARPFRSITDVENVSKKEKAKSKAKAKRLQIGSLFVDKLTSWFSALNAVGEVIVECKERGQQLETAMKDWPMDRNGLTREGTKLPISEKPKSMAENITLKSYQLLGLNWMNLLHSKGVSGILADDMGLGKTCQVISMCAHLVDSYDEDSDNPRPWPILIVVPPSVCENWMAEFGRFAPTLTICPYLGKDRRNVDPEAARENHIVLTSYSQVERQAEDLHWLRELAPYAAIFDEGHKLKNRKNLVYKQMMRVPTEWRLILSGTPVQNNLKELLTLLHFIEPDLFSGAFEELDALFESKVPNKEIHNYTALAKERVSNARAIMAPYILQRRKDDVLDLAKKTQRNIMLEMHPKQKEISEELKSRSRTKNKKTSSTIKNSHSWTQLRQVAIHHQLFRLHFTDKMVNEMVDILWKRCSEEELNVQSKADRHKALLLETYMDMSDFQLHLECKHFKKQIGRFDIPHRSWEDSPKVQMLLKLVRGYMETGDRVLVFSRFELVINILRETLSYADIPYCELTGSTDMADRFPEIERFNEDPDIPIFLLTTGAGGTGLNLTAANKIIIFDQSDNPQDDVQASNRAHRIGQTRDVEVIRFITKGTVEPLIFNSCVKKLMLARCVEGDIPVDDEAESESVEQMCRKLMLLEEEGDEK